MEQLTLKDLLDNMKKYNKEGIDQVERAYKYAELLHEIQYRQIREFYKK